MTRFEFATATEIVFGRGRSVELGARARALGTRALLLTGGSGERVPLEQPLREAGVRCVCARVQGEPTTSAIRELVQGARGESVDLVIGVGGGSVLDAAKAVAALLANAGDPLDYLEVVGRGRVLERPSLPCIAVPTTAGTGSEVTRNAVLQAEEQHVKVSLRSLFMLPRLALVDPVLTVSVPPGVTAATGLDALTQVLEPYVSTARGPLTDAWCLEGMRRAARSLARAVQDGQDLDAREDLALASLFGGLALANAKLGAVHGFAGPLGGAFAAPHGELCARLLPEVMAVNLRLLRAAGHAELVERYTLIARMLTGNAQASAEAGVAWVHELVENLRIPRLAAHGLLPEHFPSIVLRAELASSMRGNPLQLPRSELVEILEHAL